MNAPGVSLERVEQEALDLVANFQLRRGTLGVQDAQVLRDLEGEGVDAVRNALARLLRRGLLTESRGFLSVTPTGLVASSSRARVASLLMTWLAFSRDRVAAVGVTDFQFYDWRDLEVALAQREPESENLYELTVVTLLAFDLFPSGHFASAPNEHTRLVVPEDVVEVNAASTIDDLVARAERRAHERREHFARRLESAGRGEVLHWQAPGTIVHIEHATIGALAVGPGAIATGTVGGSPPRPASPASGLIADAIGSGLGVDLRSRDMEALRAFWSDFPTAEMDHFFDRAALRIVPESIFFFYDRIDERARSSSFHVHDQVTRAALKAFVTPFLRSIAKDEFFTKMSGAQWRFISEGIWAGDHSERAAELRAFKESVRDAHLAYGALVELTYRTWPEIDLQETSRRAKEFREASEAQMTAEVDGVFRADLESRRVNVARAAEALIRRARATIMAWVTGEDVQEVTLCIDTAEDEAAAEILASQGQARVTDGACTVLVRRE